MTTPDWLNNLIDSLVTRETHKGAVNRVRLYAKTQVQSHLDEAYKRGRIDEAKTCEQAQRHQRKKLCRLEGLRRAKEELEKLKQHHGAYIGIDGRRVDNMVHHDVIDERLAQIDADIKKIEEGK